MSEQDAAALNHVDIDVSDTRVETQLLDAQTLKVKTGEVGHKISGKEKKKRLVIPLELLEPGVDVNGQTVHPGTILFESFLTEPSGGWDQDSVKRAYKRAKMAILGLKEAEAGGPVGDVTQWSNKELLVKFSVRDGDKDEKYQQFRLMALPQAK